VWDGENQPSVRAAALVRVKPPSTTARGAPSGSAVPLRLRLVSRRLCDIFGADRGTAPLASASLDRPLRLGGSLASRRPLAASGL
jgi:hypothetical protein